jgi:hypothetical protein
MAGGMAGGFASDPPPAFSTCAACRLVAANNDVDIERIELDPAADAASIPCGREGRPGAEGGRR